MRDESCTERDGAGRWHSVTGNGGKFETYESFISGIFHLIFSGSKPWIQNPRMRRFYRIWFWWADLKARYHLEEPGVNGRIILNGSSKNRVGRHEWD